MEKTRKRKSRWEANESNDEEIKTKKAPPSKSEVANAVAQRLASLVKQHQATQPTNPLLTPLMLGGNTNIQGLTGLSNSIGLGQSLTTNPFANVAKAKALAQTNLLKPAVNYGASGSLADFARRIYIGNLYYELQKDDIINAFCPFGNITTLDLSMDPGCTRSKGFCFLEYDDAVAAESAVQLMNASSLGNRLIKVGRPIRGQGAPPAIPGATPLSIGQQAIKDIKTKVVYVGNVRPEITSSHIESIFSPFGKVLACVMVPSIPHTDCPHRGYGFMEFEDELVADSAIKHMHNFELAGSNLKVGKASPTALIINIPWSHDKTLHYANLGNNEDDKIDSKEIEDVNDYYSDKKDKPISKKDFISEAEKDSHYLEDLPTDTAMTASNNNSIHSVTNGTKKITSEKLREKLIREETSRCILLENLVQNKEDIDDELEKEVKLECNKFGIVENVKIIAINDIKVNIYVLFQKIEEAIEAIKVLDKRYFGGYTVSASFFDMKLYQNKEFK